MNGNRGVHRAFVVKDDQNSPLNHPSLDDSTVIFQPEVMSRPRIFNPVKWEANASFHNTYGTFSAVLLLNGGSRSKPSLSFKAATHY
jgi:hypothetical protein